MPPVGINWTAGLLSGTPVRRSRKHLADLRPLFLSGAFSPLDDSTLVYSVEWFGEGPEAAAGGLLFGCTRLEPGKVGGEYFMTHGHFHRQPSHAEFYIPVSGQGLLLRMDRGGETWAESMTPGHVLAIDGRHAHRAVNTGSEPLIFWACWPADAGYDYGTIARDGFGLRVMDRDGQAALLGAGSMEKSTHA
jgi:glucose-6-phosphate isomerase